MNSEPLLLDIPPPALVVIGGHESLRVCEDGGVPTAPAMAARPEREWLDKLVAILPPARQVLAIGDVAPALVRAHSARNPSVRWHHIGASFDASDGAAGALPCGEFVDLVICTDLGALTDPVTLLAAIAPYCSPDAVLLAVAQNGARLSRLEGLIEGEQKPHDPAARRGPLSDTTPATIYKSLLDAGWMPHLTDHTCTSTEHPAFAAGLGLMADALNVPRGTATRLLGIDHLIIQARRGFDAPPAAPSGEAGRFTVVVPTTRERQLSANVECSPGLREVNARVVSYRRAATPAEALERSLDECDSDWILLCHQDVYFPRGFGLRLQALLAAIEPGERDQTLLGFVGMGVNAQRDGFAPAGFVIDRLHRADHPASAQAVSIDELALVLSRRSVHRIDPKLGWHLWATELCLAAICKHKVFARIVRLPLFHNSLNDYRLPAAFYDSAAYLATRYPQFGPIPTLCGTIDANFLAQHAKAGQ